MSDLRQELEDLKRITVGRRYDGIRRRLNRRDYEKQKKQFEELEDYFFQMVTYVLSNQRESGWWSQGTELQNVITAHALRHLHKIGISLKARWNSNDPTDKMGNLYRTASLLINCFNPKTPNARWGTDIWDDCYILLALFEVQSEFDDEEVFNWDPKLKTKFQQGSINSLNWLKEQFDETGFKHARVTGAGWFGPGFYAAAIELFAHPQVKKRLPDADKLVTQLATTVGKMIEESFTNSVEPKWHNRFAWHVGQVLVTWHEKRKYYPVLKSLDGIMRKLFERLKERQSENGAWDNNGQVNDEEYRVYYTVRGLAACYVIIEDTQIPESHHIARAQQFLLEKFKFPDGQLINPKASINALGAFQKLFEFHVQDIFPNLLISLTARMHKLGLLDHILSPGINEVETLKGIRNSTRSQLEKRGEYDVELLGVNSQLYDALKNNSNFLKQFIAIR